jgi:hypothetical protein
LANSKLHLLSKLTLSDLQERDLAASGEGSLYLERRKFWSRAVVADIFDAAEAKSA